MITNVTTNLKRINWISLATVKVVKTKVKKEKWGRERRGYSRPLRGGAGWGTLRPLLGNPELGEGSRVLTREKCYSVQIPFLNLKFTYEITKSYVSLVKGFLLRATISRHYMLSKR